MRPSRVGRDGDFLSMPGPTLDDGDADQPSAVRQVDGRGRRQRSLDSRARIVAAMLQLVRAGDVSPSAEQVAARAGVGLRSVFRHVKDMDAALYREMADVVEARDSARPSTGPSRARLARARDRDRAPPLGGLRADRAPFQRAAEANRHRSSFPGSRATPAWRRPFVLALLRQLTAEVAAEHPAGWRAWTRCSATSCGPGCAASRPSLRGARAAGGGGGGAADDRLTTMSAQVAGGPRPVAYAGPNT